MRGPAILTPDQAAKLIPDGATIAISGSGGGLLEPSEMFPAIRRRFDAEQAPQDVTLVHSLGIGHPTGLGIELVADPGLVKRVIGGHWAWSPTMQRMVADEEVEAYAWPAGVISLLLREIGSRRPGLFTRTGLHTFVDPRLGGGRCNRAAVDELVDLVEVAGQEHLHFKPFSVDVALIRGSVADTRGNLSCVDEPASLDVLAVAKAARATGGKVIAQVREITELETIDPRLVDVPGTLIDVLVVAPEQWQTYESQHDPGYAGHTRIDRSSPPLSPFGDLPVARQLVAGRAAVENDRPAAVNVGFGMGSEVVNALTQAGMLDTVELFIEQGAIGGLPVAGELFGVSRGFDTLLSSTDQFDLFACGVLDRTFLGMAEVDRLGSVNVSRMGDRLIGPGGFIDISQYAREAVFCGTFRAGGLEVKVDGDALEITREGAILKFVDELQHITYSGPFARQEGRIATYVTERCVFALGEDGLELIEVVEGIDIERDILKQMAFEPVIASPRVVSVGEYTRNLVSGTPAGRGVST